MATQTHKGMLHLICSTLHSYAAGRGVRKDEPILINGPDCKLVLNHLLRHYGIFFLHPEPQFCSLRAESESDPSLRTREHVIPIAELMTVLMRRAIAGQDVSPSWLVEFLRKYLITCRIHKEEDKLLTSAEFAEEMPKAALLPNDEFEIWARYDHPKCKIEREDATPWLRITKTGRQNPIAQPDMSY
jgi:hypothetical protein